MMVDEALGMISKEQATGLIMNKNESLVGRDGYYGYYDSDIKD